MSFTVRVLLCTNEYYRGVGSTQCCLEAVVERPHALIRVIVGVVPVRITVSVVLERVDVVLTKPDVQHCC